MKKTKHEQRPPSMSWVNFVGLVPHDQEGVKRLGIVFEGMVKENVG